MVGALFIYTAGVGTGIGLGYGIWGEPNWVGAETTPSPPLGPEPTIGPDTNSTDYLDMEISGIGKLRGSIQVGSKCIIFDIIYNL